MRMKKNVAGRDRLTRQIRGRCTEFQQAVPSGVIVQHGIKDGPESPARIHHGGWSHHQ